jgi:stage II sporulation protein M
MRDHGPEPGGTFLERDEHGGRAMPPPQPFRPDRPSPFEGLDPSALVPPPRPDHAPAAVERGVRRYVRRPVGRHMAMLFGILLVGVVVGLVTTIGEGREVLSHDRLFTGNAGVSFTVGGIFVHNALVVIVPLLMFPILFWGPAGSLAITGFAVGRLAGLWQVLNLPNGALVLALVPHGLIEIPSFLLAGTIAWRLGAASWDFRHFGGTWWGRTRPAVLAALPFVLAAVAALAVAAVVEVKVTPALVHAVYPDL